MALTANRELDRYVDQELRALPVKGGTTIYRGALIGLSGGHARELNAADPFAGVALEECDNASGSDGDRVVRVYTRGDFEHALLSYMHAEHGDLMNSIVESGDYNEEIEETFKSAIEKFKTTQSW